MTGERYYKRQVTGPHQGDYLSVKTPRGHDEFWRGRVAVIAGQTGSVTECNVGAAFLNSECERVNARDIPAEWLEAITFDKGARLPRAGGGLTTKEHAMGVGVGGAY